MIVMGFIAAVLVPALMILWGIRLRKNPPAYLQGRLSFRTKRVREDEEIWNYSNALFSHMIFVTGINSGLASMIFYIGSMALTGGELWAPAALSLFLIQAVCVFFIYRITNYIVKKTYRSESEEDENESEEAVSVSEAEMCGPAEEECAQVLDRQPADEKYVQDEVIEIDKK